MSFMIRDPISYQVAVAKSFQKLRLFRNLRRESLAEKSGVSLSSIKRFEASGEISFRSLVKLAFVLGVEGELEGLFPLPVARSLDEIEKMEEELPRKRGRR